MRSARIDDVLRERTRADLELPAPDAGKPRKWHRFTCPFCGRPRAAVNYAVGVFVCHHAGCRVKIAPEPANRDGWTLHRFRFQLAQAVTNTQRKYGRWVATSERGRRQYDDLWQQARLTLIEFDTSGQIDAWESDVSGDQNQLDRYVLRAVDCDLMDWAKKIYRAKNREQSQPGTVIDGRSQLRADDESPEDAAIWISWPTLKLKFKYGMTVKEIAAHLGVSESTVKRRIAGEMADAEKTYRGS